MSKVCLCVLYGAKEQHYKIVSQIDSLLNKHKIYLFEGITYHEPIFDVIDKNNTIVFSISDNGIYDNCELLLLPDNCKINGFENPIPFLQRMRIIQDILKEMSRYCSSMELFAGDSGCLYNEYDELRINISDFGKSAKCMNSPNSPNVHFVFM